MGDSGKVVVEVEVGYREEEAGMGTTMHWAEEVAVGQQHCMQRILFFKKVLLLVDSRCYTKCMCLTQHRICMFNKMQLQNFLFNLYFSRKSFEISFTKLLSDYLKVSKHNHYVFLDLVIEDH